MAGAGLDREALAAALPGYDVGEELGRGSFATVYAARHRALEREVAIKVLSPALVDDEAVRERFRGEGRMLASLDHPHVVRVHDFVESGPLCALVMERLHGGTLAGRLRVGRLPTAQACAVALATLHGLEHAHQRGVLHRDVKPENLLFGDGGLLKVADFGIAKVVGAAGTRVLATATVIGTPAYMAPEQVSSALGRLSPATDVWSTGAMLYELLAGVPPFGREGELAEVLLRRTQDAAPPLHERAPDLPRELCDVVMHALALAPGDRYARAGDFAAALEPAAEAVAGPGGLAATGIPIHRTPPAPSSAPTLLESVEVPAEDAAPPPAARPPARRRAPLVAAAAALAALIVGAVVLLGGGGGGGVTAGTRAAAPADLPAAPAGWPRTLAVGLSDAVDGDPGIARRTGRGAGLATLNIGGDAKAGEDWSRDPTIKLGQFVSEAVANGLMPYVGYYEIRALGRSAAGSDAEAADLVRTLKDPELMALYWRNVRALLQQLGRTGRPVAVSVESGFWALLEADLATRGGAPGDVKALVGGSGVPELRGLPDTLPGFAAGWKALRDRYAKRVLLGYVLDEYGSPGLDLSRTTPSRATLRRAARRSGAFHLAVTTGSTSRPFDFAAYEVGYSEETSSPDARRFSAAEKRSVAGYLREFVRVTGTPVVLEGVPLGNTATRATTDQAFHWGSSWVQWLFGDARFTQLRALRDAGVIGMTVGFEPGKDATCACDAADDGITNDGPRGATSSSADDDGGYLAARLAALRKAGGLPLRRSG